MEETVRRRPAITNRILVPRIRMITGEWKVRGRKAIPNIILALFKVLW
jgi:hypothetical protein